MADNSKIEWTEATWQPITGCSVVSPGCTNCYAMRLAGTRLRHHPSRTGLTTESKAGPVWTGKVRLNEQWLMQPLQWKRPRMIFVCAHGDLFHESVPDEWIDRVFGAMGAAPHHTYQILTKRSARMRNYLLRRRAEAPQQPSIGGGLLGYHPFNREVLPPQGVWLGVSAERQQEADERIPHLLATPAALRWLSAEPLLGPIDLAAAMSTPQALYVLFDKHARGESDDRGSLHWVVVGGESGAGARPMHPEWARSLRDQCAGANVPFFFKQWGNWAPRDAWEVHDNYWKTTTSGDSVPRFPSHMWDDVSGAVDLVGKKAAGRLLDGREHNGMPERAP